MAILGAMYVEHNPDSWEGWHWGPCTTGDTPGGWDSRTIRPPGGRPEKYRDGSLLVQRPGSYLRDIRRGGINLKAFLAEELGVKAVFIDPYYNSPP